MTNAARPISPAARKLLEGYAPRAGVADELFDGAGQLRPVWAPLLDYLEGLNSAEIDEHFARGDAYLRDAGVYFRQYGNGDAPERDWPLSHVPVLIHEAEWAEICKGLNQRAELLEQVVADLYGPARLVKEGHLPPELVARNPQWLRPMVGVSPASGHYLHHLAFEISRNPDGSWFVLGDRAQAPSGTGFALENRMAMLRVFGEPFPRDNIHRLAGFFSAFRDTMERLSAPHGGQAAILTPGPNNDIYFEHTFIARYLGLALLEGDDMIVQDGQLMVRTVEGPEPIGALWRRLDSNFADPLELDGRSFLGTPGLINALRQGSLSMVNALGSGVLEMPALMAFLPKISQVVMGEDLILPNIATWWCGQKAERDYVRRNAARMMIGTAINSDLANGARSGFGPDALEDPAQAALMVGQELVTLSTTPAYEDGRLVPRPMTVRVAAVRTQDGWAFMPGGFARIGTTPDATALAMQHGATAADVWIMGDGRAPDETLLPEGGTRRRETGALPSRAAENLFWLGRYVERTEASIRLLRAYHLRLAEGAVPEEARVQPLAGYLKRHGLDVEQPVPQVLRQMLASARTSAGTVRDRFSPDGWAALGDLAKTVATMSGTLTSGDDTARAMGVLLRKITGFNGLVHENMYRFSGWNFLSFGRALERADGLASVLSEFLYGVATVGGADLALELGDSVMAHRRRYRGEASTDSAADLLALDPDNPRAILFQISRMRGIVEQLPDRGRDPRKSPLLRAVLPLETRFTVADPQDVTAEVLDDLRGDLAALSDQLSSLYLR